MDSLTESNLDPHLKTTSMEKAYYKTRESVDEYIKLAEGLDGSQLIDKFTALLNPGSSILEIGSGPGTDWEILSRDFTVTGSDYSPEFLRRLKAKYPGQEFLELEASTLRVDKTFDGIYSNKVLHHLRDNELKASIQRQTEILKPGGLICHSFWEGEGDEIFKGLYVNYHSETRLRDLFEVTFEILVLEAYKEFEDGDSRLLIGRRTDD
jgi:cyclopropane fatty-acyl-phospholipid synthase-like methyltransferase